ncbi:c-type cytochrome [Opitutaceae bacterium]|nr:c-type cytochrome [Opitutaceae bacterium]
MRYNWAISFRRFEKWIKLRAGLCYVLGNVFFISTSEKIWAKDGNAFNPDSPTPNQVLVNPLEPTKENLAMGRDIFYRMCVTCHGMDGKGQTDTARTLVTKPSDFTLGEFRYGQADGNLFNVVQNGSPNGMVPYKDALEDDKIWQLVHYIRSFDPIKSPEVSIDAEPVLENPIEPSIPSIVRGKQFYARFCVKCHGANGKGDTEMREFLKTKPADLTDGTWTFGSRDGDLFKVIKEGTDNDMESFADRLVDERIWHVVNYLKSLGPKD